MDFGIQVEDLSTHHRHRIETTTGTTKQNIKILHYHLDKGNIMKDVQIVTGIGKTGSKQTTGHLLTYPYQLDNGLSNKKKTIHKNIILSLKQT